MPVGNSSITNSLRKMGIGCSCPRALLPLEDQTSGFPQQYRGLGSLRGVTEWLELLAELLPERRVAGIASAVSSRPIRDRFPERPASGSRMPLSRAVRASRWLSATAGSSWLAAVIGCGHTASTDADRAALTATAAAAEAHALASNVAGEAEVEDGAALAESAWEAVEAAQVAQAEAWERADRGSADAAWIDEAVRMTDAAWERAKAAAEAASMVWDVALSVAASNDVGPGDIATLAAADSAWERDAAWHAAMIEANTWDSPPIAGRLRAEWADSLARLLRPWAAVDSAAAVRVFAEHAARDAAATAAYDAAEATKDSTAVAAYEAAAERFRSLNTFRDGVLVVQKDAADSAADRAGQRAWQAVVDAGDAAYYPAWETRWRTRPGSAAREAAVAATERAFAARSDWDAAREARDAAERAHGGGAYYAALRARDTARDTAEATKDSAAVAAYEQALEELDPWSTVEPETKVRLAALKARAALDAVSAAVEAWVAASRSHRGSGP